MTEPNDSIFVEFPGEEWRPVVGYEGFYEVSSQGRIRALFDAHKYKAGRILRFAVTHDGHLRVELTPPGCHRRGVYVHRLLWEAFCGPIPAGKRVLHWDGNPKNNVVSNLRCGTDQDNSDDKRRHGTTIHGERNGKSKLTTQDVYTIRVRLAAGEMQKNIAQEFGVTKPAISNIYTRKTWPHI